MHGEAIPARVINQREFDFRFWAVAQIAGGFVPFNFKDVEIVMSLIERIKELCSKRCITIYKLEKTLGLAQNTIKNWDKVIPTCKILQLVADYFDVSMDFLLGRTQNCLSHKGQISEAGIIILNTVEQLQITVGEAYILSETISSIVKGFHKADSEQM